MLMISIKLYCIFLFILYIDVLYMDGIMHKWSNPHFVEIALQHEVQDKTKTYKLTQKANKISDQTV